MTPIQKHLLGRFFDELYDLFDLVTDWRGGDATRSEVTARKKEVDAAWDDAIRGGVPEDELETILQVFSLYTPPSRQLGAPEEKKSPGK